MSRHLRKKSSVFWSAVALLIGLFISQSVFARERQGGIVKIKMKDGTTIMGELIAVRDGSLLVDANTMEFSSTPVAKINNLSVKRNSHVAGGVILGLLGGSLLGASIGYFGKPSDPRDTGLFSWSDFGKPLATLFGAGIGAFVGGFIGRGIASAQSSDLVLIRGGHCFITEAEMLKKLKSQAKVPDAI